jgi:hypothetical protein
LFSPWFKYFSWKTNGDIYCSSRVRHCMNRIRSDDLKNGRRRHAHRKVAEIVTDMT